MEGYTLEQAEDEIADLRGQVQRMSEILTLVNGTNAPNTPAGAVSLFASGGQPNYVNPAGLTMGLVGAQNATFPGTAVTAATLTNLATATIPANDPEVGAIYELDVWGSGTQATGTRQPLTLGVALGGTAMQNFILGTTAFSAAAVTFRWWAKVQVVNVTTGPSGTWNSFIFGHVNDNTGNIAPANNNFGSGFACDAGTTSTISTTASQTLALQAAWGATTGAPVLTSRVSVFKRIA